MIENIHEYTADAQRQAVRDAGFKPQVTSNGTCYVKCGTARLAVRFIECFGRPHTFTGMVRCGGERVWPCDLDHANAMRLLTDAVEDCRKVNATFFFHSFGVHCWID